MTCLVLVIANTAARAGDFTDLIRRLPSDVNMIALMDVTSLLDNPVGQKESWREMYESQYAASPVMIPPSATRVVIGSEMDMEALETRMEVAVMTLATNPSAADVERVTGGVSDNLYDTDVVWATVDTCVAKLGPSEFGVMKPATRQAAARWIRDATQSDSSELSSYLNEAVNESREDDACVVVALDLNQLLHPVSVRRAIDESALFKQLDRQAAAKVLQSLRGVTLKVHVDREIRATLSADFDEEATLLADIAKPLMMGVLKKVGAALPDLERWEASVESKRMSLAGPMTTDDLRRLLSLITLDAGVMSRPSTSADDQATQTTERTSPPPTTPPTTSTTGRNDNQDQMATASARYFRSLNRYLNDLQRDASERPLSDVALWMNTYANKIEKIPSRNVDPDLLEFAQHLTYTLRDAVGQIHGIQERANRAISQVRPKRELSVGFAPVGGWGWGGNTINYGGYRVRRYAPFAYGRVDIGSALDERDAIRDEDLNARADTAQQAINQVLSDAEDMRKTLSQRYDRPF